METTRRAVLAATATVAVGTAAGCADDPDADGTLRVVVNNQLDAAQEVTVTVTDGDGERRVDTTDTVPASVSRPFESSGYEGGQYTIRVRGPDWATSSVWQPGTCRDYEFLTRLESNDGTPMVTAESSCREE